MTMLLRTLWIFGVLFFLLAVAVQYNDPDPLVWMSLYGIVAAASLLALFNRLSPRWVLIATIPHFLIGMRLSPNLLRTSVDAFRTVGMKNDLDELVREAWGSVICILWMAGLYLHARRLARRTHPEVIA
jgi:hypothetical protein